MVSIAEALHQFKSTHLGHIRGNSFISGRGGGGRRRICDFRIIIIFILFCISPTAIFLDDAFYDKRCWYHMVMVETTGIRKVFLPVISLDAILRLRFYCRKIRKMQPLHLIRKFWLHSAYTAMYLLNFVECCSFPCAKSRPLCLHLNSPWKVSSLNDSQQYSLVWFPPLNKIQPSRLKKLCTIMHI